MKRFSIVCAIAAFPIMLLSGLLQPADPARAEQIVPVAAAAALPVAAEPAAQPSPDSDDPALLAAEEPDPRQVECVAKVIIHEAGNQVRRGQIAVAQVVRARMKAFGPTRDACDIIKQPGQFFNVDRYQPSRNTAQWRNAVEIATATLKGEGEDVVPGALFFHTATRPMAGRLRVGRIDDHVFYR